MQKTGDEECPQSAILATRWFPAAHLDYYVARPNGTVVKTMGPIEKTHKYGQITEKRGGITLSEPFYYIESSRFRRNSGNRSLDTFLSLGVKTVIRTLYTGSQTFHNLRQSNGCEVFRP